MHAYASHSVMLSVKPGDYEVICKAGAWNVYESSGMDLGVLAWFATLAAILFYGSPFGDFFANGSFINPNAKDVRYNTNSSPVLLSFFLAYRNVLGSKLANLMFITVISPAMYASFKSLHNWSRRRW